MQNKSLSVNEMIALYNALSFIDVKDLLVSAMNELNNSNKTIDKDNANLLFFIVHTYLV